MLKEDQEYAATRWSDAISSAGTPRSCEARGLACFRFVRHEIPFGFTPRFDLASAEETLVFGRGGGPDIEDGLLLRPRDDRERPPARRRRPIRGVCHKRVAADPLGCEQPAGQVAIKGARADLFLGAGRDAEVTAGRTKERGRLYLLTPRS